MLVVSETGKFLGAKVELEYQEHQVLRTQVKDASTGDEVERQDGAVTHRHAHHDTS